MHSNFRILFRMPFANQHTPLLPGHLSLPEACKVGATAILALGRRISHGSHLLVQAPRQALIANHSPRAPTTSIALSPTSLTRLRHPRPLDAKPSPGLRLRLLANDVRSDPVRLRRRGDAAASADQALLGALDDGLGLAEGAASARDVAFDADRHRRRLRGLPLQRRVVEAHDHAGQVVGAEARQRVLDQLPRRLLRVARVADQVDGVLVGADVPELAGGDRMLAWTR